MNWDKLFSTVKATAAMAALAAVAYIGESGKDGGFIKDIWAAAKTASPFAAMFSVMMFLRADAAARRAQEELLERTISFVNAANQQSSALEKLTGTIKEIGGAITNRISQDSIKYKGRGR
jgi:hypothetical protein